MERLTKRWCGSVELASHVNEDCATICHNNICENCMIQKAFNKLAEYEDLEEQGLLLRLPCKVGDTVYSPTRNFISVYVVESIELYKKGFYFNWHCIEGIYINVCGFSGEEIGKTVFLTKEEAEKHLRK